jgi:predicted lipoprotein
MMRSGAAALASVALLALGSCVPWTVRPIDEKPGAGQSGDASLNPAAYVDRIWSSRLLPAILESAVDARTLLDALAASPEAAREKYGRRQQSGPAYFIVKGAGRVLEVDTRSRNGILTLDIAPPDGAADVAIQIGPVLRGTSLRDSTGIVRFSDFVNQLQFADVSNELNARVLGEVLRSVNPAALRNKVVSFAGTATLGEGGQPPIRDLIPVKLTVEAGR